MIYTQSELAFMEAYKQTEQSAYDNSVAHGFWDEPRDKGRALMLIVCEVAEAMEGVRKNRMDDHLPHRLMEEVELADVIIRCFDYGKGFGLDVPGAIIEKMRYNVGRPRLHGKLC